MENDAKEYSNGDKKEKNFQTGPDVDCFDNKGSLEKILKKNAGAFSADTANQPKKQAEIVKRIENIEDYNKGKYA